MHRGYVLLWRRVEDAGWIRNHKLWSFWSWCLIKASYKKRKVVVGLQEIDLEPGQFIFGRKSAAEATDISERSIRTIVDFLVKSQNLTIKTTSKFSIISIVNWHIYQQPEIENDHQNDQRLTNYRPTTDQQLTTNNKENKVNHSKIKRSKTVSFDDDPNFALFWDYYPKKVGKLDALKAWKKNNHPDINKILDAVDQQKQSAQWLQEGGRYIPNPSTWLNQGRWDDRLEKENTKFSDTTMHNLRVLQKVMEKDGEDE